MEQTKTIRNLKYVYSEEERVALSIDLATCNNKLTALENEKKTYVSQIAASINEHKERIAGLSNKVANGYEFREVECEVTFNKPKNGRKTIVRMDTGEEWEEAMLAEDYNLFNMPGEEPDDEVPEVEPEVEEETDGEGSEDEQEGKEDDEEQEQEEEEKPAKRGRRK